VLSIAGVQKSKRVPISYTHHTAHEAVGQRGSCQHEHKYQKRENPHHRQYHPLGLSIVNRGLCVAQHLFSLSYYPIEFVSEHQGRCHGPKEGPRFRKKPKFRDERLRMGAVEH